MIVTVKNEVDRARGQAARSPEQGLAGALQGQYKRQDKNRFFRAENLGYTNNRPSLSSTHRSVSPSGELSNGDGSPVRFLYLLLGIGSFPFLYLLLTHRSVRLHGSSNLSQQSTTARSFFEHASILSPSIRSPHGSANGYASMETYLLFAIYLPLRIGSLGQLWNALELAPRAMNELLNWGLSSRFFSFVCIPS